VLVFPAGHAPVAEGKVELVDTLTLLLVEVVVAKRTGRDGVVLLLIPILLRDVNLFEVAGLDERPITNFDKDVVGLDVWLARSPVLVLAKFSRVFEDVDDLPV
jgi:hypothetical protein